MPRNATGLIVHFDEDQRAALIREGIDGGFESFSDALSVPELEVGHLSSSIRPRRRP